MIQVFQSLGAIDDSNDGGKRATERVSAIRYLLALSNLLQTHPNRPTSINLAPNSTERASFRAAVGKIVSLNSFGLYTKNFKDQFGDDRNYDTDSNFLTTFVKRTRNRSERLDYPADGRLKPLIFVSDEKASIHGDAAKNLDTYYNINSIRAPLSLWLTRNKELFRGSSADASIVQELLKQELESLFTPDVATAITPTVAEVDGQLALVNSDERFSSSPTDLTFLPSHFTFKSGAATDVNLDATPEIALSSEDLLPELQECLKLIRAGFLTILLRGHPGTGKTWIARQASDILTNGDRSRQKFIQFHPSFGYEDFVEGLASNGALGGTAPLFSPRKKVFANFCDVAASRSNELFVFVIDELTRGDPQRIFGELLTYMEKDYREKEFNLPFSGEPFSVPSNVVIIATMNASDRSVVGIDHAVLRRFKVIEISPNSEVLRSILTAKFDNKIHSSRVVGYFNKVNEKSLVPIGHALFVDFSPEAESGRSAWKYSLRPYLMSVDLDSDTIDYLENQSNSIYEP